jgi:hypothetical protein
MRLEIYPNAFFDKISINFSTKQSINELKSVIYNAAGRLIKSFNNLANQRFNHDVIELLLLITIILEGLQRF